MKTTKNLENFKDRKIILSTLWIFVTANYIFYSIIEIGCTVFIVWYAWTWTNKEPGNTQAVSLS